MRIIQVVNVRWFNATAWYGLYLARLLGQAGHEVLCLCQNGTETHEKALQWGLAVKTPDINSAGPLALTRAWRELDGLMAEFKPEVVNCHRGEAFILFGLLKKRHGYKLIRTRGDQRPPKNNLPNRILHERYADCVVATNSVMARHFLEVFGLPESKVKTVIGGVDRERFRFDQAGRERVRQEFGFAEEDQVVGLMGRFDAVKGQREAIRALAHLRNDHGLKRARLMLLGFPTATSQEEVRSWIAENGLEDSVAVTGKRCDVAACVSAMDVGLVASLWSETIARAALEIMSCGVPLVGTDVGVMSDLLPDEALTRPGDPKALAELLARAISDGARLDRLRELEAERMRDLDAASFLAKTLAIYQGA